MAPLPLALPSRLAKIKSSVQKLFMKSSLVFLAVFFVLQQFGFYNTTPLNMSQVPLCPGCGIGFANNQGFLSHLRQTSNRACAESFHNLVMLGSAERNEPLQSTDSDNSDKHSENTTSSASSPDDVNMESSQDNMQSSAASVHAQPEFGPEEDLDMDIDMETQLVIEDDEFNEPWALDSDNETEEDEDEYYW